MSKKDKEEIRIIPNIGYADDWQKITRLDVSIEAFMARMDHLEKMLKEQVGFDGNKVSAALVGLVVGTDAKARKQEGFDVVMEVIEEAAIWARAELAKLRQLENDARLEKEGRITRDKSESPVLHGNVVSRIELSDLAVTLLQVVEEPGEELCMLLAELLNVDRHRQANADKNGPYFGIAAQLVAQEPDIKNADLAKITGRDKGTISRWRQKPEFEDEVASYKRVFSGEIREAMLKKKMDT